MRLFDPFFSLSATKIGFFIKKVSQNSFLTKTIVHDFSRARFRAYFFLSCMIFFVISNPGPNDWKWTVLSQSGRSQRLKVDGLRLWTVLKFKSGRSKVKWLYDLKYWIWTVSRDKSRRSKGMKLDCLKESMWTVPRPKNGRSKGMKLDGHTGTVPLVKLGFGWY